MGRFFFIVGFVILVSCQWVTPSGRKQPFGPDAKVVKTAVEGSLTSLNPRRHTDRRSQPVMGALYEGLTRLNGEGRPELALAQEFHLSPDQTTYSFYLRETFWSDGTPVVAADFVESWRELFRSHPSAALFPLRDRDISRISSQGTQVVVVELAHPVPYFLEILADPMYAPYKGGRISTGPYRVVSHRPKILVLERNPYYWDLEGVTVDGLVFRFIDHSSKGVDLFQAGEVDWISEPLVNLHTDEDRDLYQLGLLQQRPTVGVIGVAFNTNEPPLNSADARRKLAVAIDRSLLATTLGEGDPEWRVVPAVFSSLPPEEKPAIVVTDASFNQPLVLCCCEDDKALALALQNQWEVSGIDVVVDTVPRGTSPSGHMVMITTQGRYADLADYLEQWRCADGSDNPSHWQHPVYVHLLDKAAQQGDAELRDAYLRRAEILIQDEVPFLPCFTAESRSLGSETATGVSFLPLGQIQFRETSGKTTH